MTHHHYNCMCNCMSQYEDTHYHSVVNVLDKHLQTNSFRVFACLQMKLISDWQQKDELNYRIIFQSLKARVIASALNKKKKRSEWVWFQQATVWLNVLLVQIPGQIREFWWENNCCLSQQLPLMCPLTRPYTTYYVLLSCSGAYSTALHIYSLVLSWCGYPVCRAVCMQSRSAPKNDCAARISPNK